MDLDAFTAGMGEFFKHWFELVPDASRPRAATQPYVLTPTIEKYLEAFAGHRLLQPFVGKPGLPAVNGDYLAAMYVPYLTKKPADPETDVGHATVKRDRALDDFDPAFVFTATMNGCAFAVTGSADEDSFTAWHFQSPTAHETEAAGFRQEKQPTDWFGSEQYQSPNQTGLFEVTNMLHRGQGGWEFISQEVSVSYDAKAHQTRR